MTEDPAAGSAPPPQSPPPDSPPTAPPSSPPPPPPPPDFSSSPSLYERSAPFFDAIRRWGVVRTDERWIAGVSGGLSRRLSIDPLLARGIVVVVAVLTGIGLLLYGLAWLFLPQTDGRIHAQEALRGNFSAGFIGGVVLVLFDLGPGNEGPFGLDNWGWWGWGPGGLILVALIVGFAWWWGNGRGGVPASPSMAAPTPGPAPAAGPGGPGEPPAGPSDYPSDAPPYPTASDYTPGSYAGGPTLVKTAPPVPRVDHSRPSHAISLATSGAAILAAALVIVWDSYVWEVAGGALVMALAAALGVVALGVVAAGVLGRRAGGLAPIGIVLAVALLLAPAVPSWRTSQAFGTRTVTPTSAAQAEQTFSLGAGELVVDLTSASLFDDATAASPTEVEAEVGAGSLIIIVPEDESVVVHAHAGVGVVPSGPQGLNEEAGPGMDSIVRLGSGRERLVVDAEVGFGQIQVQTAASSEVTS